MHVGLPFSFADGSMVATHAIAPHVELVGVQVDTFAAFDAALPSSGPRTRIETMG
jgi:hypothetical protein